MAIADNTEKISQLLGAINALPNAGDTGGSTDPVLQDVTITANGTYTPGTGYDGFGEVAVNVPVPSGYIKPSGTFTATENGTFDIAEYASVLVDVATGGSGGGLPDGVLALASGTITPTQDYTSGTLITHNLGVVPNFIVWWMEDAITGSIIAFTAPYALFGAIISKTAQNSASSSVIYNNHWFIGGNGSGGSFGRTQGSVDNSTYMTTTQARMHCTSSYPIKSGYTYRWVCGLVDGIS